ncbi:ceramidase domain-containing protein [Herbaspirillum sp. C7C8]|uniref:ceramidase domain-containing protein n=1 Tax=Herbaspirillum sp. C7C8 TaxID=2736665 RepID=UPI001F5229D5|nr:ceramidase domain-containing protein [Herbaspirillum sp. C7C8]
MPTMIDSLFSPVDLYCERIGTAFWAEPVNAISNIAFLLAAYFLWCLPLPQDRSTMVMSRLLTLMVAVIGVGSFLFHTFAQRWALFADVIPISIYQVLFLAFYVRKVARCNWAVTMGWVLFFLVVTYGVGMLPQRWLNGSVASYGSAWLFIGGLGLYHWRRGRHEPMSLLLAASLFTLSLVLRSMDMAVCPTMSIGTHMFWHVLNGLVLYLSTRAFMSNTDAVPRP